MKHSLIRLDRFIATVEIRACMILLVTIAVVTGAGVFARYVMRSPLIWGVDVGIMSLIWLTFLGASLLFRQNGHLAASTLPQMLPDNARIVVELFSGAVIVVSIVVVGWFGIVAALVQNQQMIITLGIPRSFFSIPIIWMAISMLLVVIVRIIRSRDISSTGDTGA